MNRQTPEMNASSMADIAFLLLIFFLVSTSMDIDKGITVMLPPPIHKDVKLPKIPDRNVLSILVNFNDQLMVEGESTEISELKDLVMKHIDNYKKDPKFSDSPQKAVISLQNDESTSYKRYIEVYNEIRAGYKQLRNRMAQDKFNLSYDQLEKAQQKIIKDHYPLKLSESEATDLKK